MKTKEIGLLSNEALDAVVGGMMNNGQGDLLPKAPGALPGRGENGAPGNSSQDWMKFVGGLISFGALAGLSLGL